MVEGSHQKFDLLFVFHSVRISPSFGISTHQKFVFEEMKDVVGDFWHSW